MRCEFCKHAMVLLGRTLPCLSEVHWCDNCGAVKKIGEPTIVPALWHRAKEMLDEMKKLAGK